LCAGTFVPSGLGGVFTTRVLPDFHEVEPARRIYNNKTITPLPWSDTLNFTLTTLGNVGNGAITCAATAQAITTSNSQGVQSPVFLNSSA
jgi:hypothetical protein